MCPIDGCVNDIKSLGLCNLHYQRAKYDSIKDVYNKNRREKRLKNPEQARLTEKLYKLSNPDKLKKYSTTDTRRIKSGRNGAKRRGLVWELTTSQWKFLTSLDKCTYCSGPLPKSGSGIDRVDNRKGYIFENCVSCCQECNRIKGDKLTFNEMIQVANLLKKLKEVI